jgi:hypothetical protein
MLEDTAHQVCRWREAVEPAVSLIDLNAWKAKYQSVRTLSRVFGVEGSGSRSRKVREKEGEGYGLYTFHGGVSFPGEVSFPSRVHFERSYILRTET